MQFTRLRWIAKLFATAIFLLAGLSLCATDIGASSNPVPYIDSISPISAAPGGADFMLTVNGTNFVNGATVYWSGTALSTSFVSAEQLTATVTAALIMNSGTGWITVTNPGPRTSNRLFMPVGASSAHDNFANFTYPAGASPVGVVQEDVNGDGNLDLITANYIGNTLSVYLGNGDGTFQNPTTVTLPASTGGRLAISITTAYLILSSATTRASASPFCSAMAMEPFKRPRLFRREALPTKWWWATLTATETSTSRWSITLASCRCFWARETVPSVRPPHTP